MKISRSLILVLVCCALFVLVCCVLFVLVCCMLLVLVCCVFLALTKNALLSFASLRSTETEPQSIPFKGVVDLKELSSVRPRSILLEYESQLQPVQSSRQTRSGT